MAYTQAQLDAIREAIARGEKSVTFADRTVVYRSMEELIQAEREIAASLTTRPKQSLAVTSKGF